MRRGYYLFLAAVLAALAISAYLIFQSRGTSVETAKVEQGEAVDLVYATGFVEPQQPVQVSSRLTSPVKRVLVGEGQRVSKGQPLLLLDDAEQRGLLAQARAKAQNAAVTRKRISTLYQQGWVTRAAFDQAVTADLDAKASVEALSARVDQAVVRAGISGLVLRQDVYPGDLAVPGKQLMQLGDPALARVTATVDERDITRVQIGQEALMSSEALGMVLRGRVREITPSGDPSQRAFRVRISLASGDELPLGLTLEVNIVTGRHDNALLVPASALAGDHLFVVDDKRARERKVTQGVAGPNKVEILSGLKRGETVVVNPPAGLQDGDKIRR